jgi:DNA-binding transcriptional LysR family regulator
MPILKKIELFLSQNIKNSEGSRCMNHRQLETFYWAARLGSFAKAAGHLNATQSAISMRIQELEARLGTALFDRSQRAARLTPQGALLLPLAEEVLLASERFLSAAATDKSEIGGYIRLGVAEIVALTWLPELIRAMRRSYPRVQLEIEVALSHLIEEKLYHGTLDMAFATCEVPPSQFISTYLDEVPFVWVASPSLDGVPEMVTPKALSGLPIIATSREWQFRGSTLSWLTVNDVHFRDVTICNTFRTAASLAMAGLGLAYVPERLYVDDFAAGRLRRVTCHPENQPLKIFTIRSLTNSTPAQQALETTAQQIVTGAKEVGAVAM